MCIQFRSYLRGARFIIQTDHKSLVWLHRFKDTEGMMARWLHTLQQFQFSIVHRAGRDNSNADGLSRVPTFHCGPCTRVDCPRVDTAVEVADQPYARKYGCCGITLITCRQSDMEEEKFTGVTVASACATTGQGITVSGLSRFVVWRSFGPESHTGPVESPVLLVGMADDVKDWLRQCTTCMKRKSPTGRHHPLGNIPTAHRWDRITMDILDVCDPTPDGYRYILVIADYFRKWTETFPIKDKCADTVADVLVNKIILRFGMPLVIHSDQGREFENSLMKSLCSLLGCVKTRTAPYHPESDGMVERFNRTCLMMLSMFVNDWRDNWSELLPFVMHAYRSSVHESTGYSPFRLMMGEECSLPQDVSTDELRTNREQDVAPHPFATWVQDALEVAYDHVRQSLQRTAARRKRLYDVKAVNR